MKDEATPEQLEMARRVYTQFIIDNTPGAGADDVPKFDDNAHGVRIALAAIIETTELAAKFAETIDPLDGPAIAALLRAGDHLKGQQQ